MGKNRLLAAGV